MRIVYLFPKIKNAMIIRKKDQIFLPAKKFGVSQMCEYRVIKHEKGGKYTLRATSFYVEPYVRIITKSKSPENYALKKVM